MARLSSLLPSDALQDEKFLITKRSFERQYAQLYFSRLMLLQPLMEQLVQKAWPDTRGAHKLGRGSGGVDHLLFNQAAAAGGMA
jgi:hypothetical protein